MKKLLFSLIALIIGIFVHSQDSFELVIKREGTEFGYFTLELADGEYLTFGNTIKESSHIPTPIIVKYLDSLNYSVEVLPKEDTAYFFRHGIEKENGNYLFIGGLHDTLIAERFNTVYLCEMTPDLEFVWEKFYPIPEGDYYLSMGDFLVDEDSNIVISAGMRVFPYSNNYLYLAKFNMNGDLLAENFAPEHRTYVYNDIIPKPDGSGYFVLGTVNHGYTPLDWIELDKDLDIGEWVSEPFGGENWIDPPVTAKWLSNDNLVLVCQAGVGDYDNDFRLCNPDFTTIRDTLIYDPIAEYTPVCQGMDFVDDDLIWVATFDHHLASVGFDYVFMVYLYDSELNLKGMKTFGGDSQWWFEHLLATSDGGCILTGAEREEGSTLWNELDLYILKLMPDDIYTHAEDTPLDNDRDVALYPNPVKDYLYIETARRNLNIRILDNLGKEVCQQEISRTHDKINLNTLKGGIYYYMILDGHKIIQNGKLMKQ